MTMDLLQVSKVSPYVLSSPCQPKACMRRRIKHVAKGDALVLNDESIVGQTKVLRKKIMHRLMLD